jgi:hypothetical protein
MRNNLAAEVELADRQIRLTHTDQPTAIIEPVARAAFARVGLVLGDEELAEYATSVRDDTEYEIALN